MIPLRIVGLLLIFLFLPSAYALTTAEQELHDSAIMQSRVPHCGGWIPCSDTFNIDHSGDTPIDLSNSLEINLDYLDNTPSGIPISIEFGHSDDVQVTRHETNCTQVTLGNGSIEQECTIIPVNITQQQIVFSTEKILYPGTNLVRVSTNQKPADAIVDWNIRFTIPGEESFLESEPVTFDTRNKGWAVWSGGEGSTNFQYYRTISVNSTVSATLTDFPAHITINTSQLINAGKLQSDCDDLRVTNGTVGSSTVTLLDYEIEAGTCNSTSTIVWVRTPSLPSNGYNLTIYYGNTTASSRANPTSLWQTAGYDAVYHAAEASWSGSAVDSSGQNNGTFGGAATIVQCPSGSGFGKCWNFTAEATGSAYITTPGFGLSSTNVTVSARYTPKVEGVSSDTYSTLFAGTTTDYYVYHYRTSNYMHYSNGNGVGGTHTATNSIVEGGPHFVSYRVSQPSPSNARMQVNATIANGTINQAFGATESSTAYYIGLNKYNNQLQGYLDEIRIAKRYRSDDWMTAEYAQTYTLGQEQIVDSFSAANETDGRSAIITGIAASEIGSSYTAHYDRQVYIRIANGSQYKGTFDVFIASGSKRWAFNYDNESTNNFPAFANITPVFWIWQQANLSTANITADVSSFINSTN